MTTALPASFQAAVNRLHAWQQATGLIDPPATVVHTDGFALGQWLAQQRHRHRTGTLAPARGAILDAAGITWDFAGHRPSPDVTARWWKHLHTVAVFTSTHGRAPRLSDRADDGLNLGDWLARQREALTAGRLTSEQITALDALSCAWRTSGDTGRWTPDDTVFAQRIDALAAYATETGHANPPQSHHTTDGFALGQWLADQRWYRRQGKLAAHREEALTALGVSWSPSRHRRALTSTPDPSTAA